MPNPLLHDRDGDVAILTFNRPDALNALSSALLRELVRQLHACDADPDIGAIVLTGQGDRAFTAGMDLKEASESTDAFNTPEANPARAIEACRTPIIAAVNGLCITGGMELILATDIVLASEAARFGDTHVRLGLLPGWGLSQRLARTIGPQRAKEVSLTGTLIDAQRALELGFVNRVLPADDLVPRAIALGHEIAANEHGIVQTYKALIDDGFALSLESGLELEVSRARELTDSLRPGQIAQSRITTRERNRNDLARPSGSPIR